MNREVAIKRIRNGLEDRDLLEESTRQLTKEAGALASLQHPHIVTVYDIGFDDEGPYVVMELISGKTIDELVERAPLTWEDFRELALQTQEALIAAQELDLVHRDIKPSNIMLAWLPSGKFQIKIVDFGLAKLAQQPSTPPVGDADSIFGSIYFMAPEQFERAEPDARTDLYAMGCVYYYALTGTYPFQGTTGPDVMAAHLHHQITPLREVRDELPSWVCDWVMWHLNRMPDDRPASARDSLQVFLQNEKAQPTAMSQAQPPSDSPKRPRLIIPGAPAPTAESTPAAEAAPTPASPEIPRVMAEAKPITSSVKTQTAPQPLTPPEGSKPSVYTSSHPLPADPSPTQPPPPPQPTPEPAPAATPAPAPVIPLRTVQTPAATAGKALVPGKAPATASAPPHSALHPRPAAHPVALPSRKKGLPNGVKVAIAVVLAILTVLMAWILIQRQSENRQNEVYNQIINEAAKGDATEVRINRNGLEMLLRSATNVGLQSAEQRQTVYKALRIASATDDTNIDKRIAEFATTTTMMEDVREVLIRDVLRLRKNPDVIPILLDYAQSTENERAATAALQAVRFMATDEVFDRFLSVVQFTPSESVRVAAEETMMEILKKSPKRETLGARIATSYAGAGADSVRHSLLRLLGRVGGPAALDLVKKNLQSAAPQDRVAALVALGQWVDDSAFPTLVEFHQTTTDESLKTRAFDAAHRFITEKDTQRSPAQTTEIWQQVANLASTRADQEKTVRSLAVLDPDAWVIALVESFTTDNRDERVIDLAEKALDHLREKARVRAADQEE